MALSPALAWDDCKPDDLNGGKYEVVFKDLTNPGWNGHEYYMVHPKIAENDTTKFPVVVFMHGSTARWEMYEENLKLYASHGFVVLFPFIHSPYIDTLPISLNTDGKFIKLGIDYLKDINTNKDTLPELYDQLDMSNLIINGHSMGGTCTIMAANTLEKGVAKAAIA